ncbi:hypothetical protein ACKKBG_A03750 [Auxenochlorella protothecoides x Auxenochlorella symbiontica]
MASPRKDPASDGEVSDDTASLSPSFNSQDGIVDSSRVTNGVQKLKLSAEHAVSRPQIRVVIDLNRVGAFIGKGGEAIKQLARESGTIMGVEALVPGSESRVVTITTAAEGEEAAATLVAGLTAAAAAITAGDKPSDSPLRLLVPGAHIGQLLGKGGATIAAIRRDSGADIKILPRGELPPAARVSDELVTVRGLGAAAALARIACELAAVGAAAPARTGVAAAVDAQLVGRLGHAHESFSRGLTEAGAPGGALETALRLLVPAEAVGGLVGRGGEHIERVRRETGATVRVVDGASRDAPAVVLATSVEDAAAPHCAAQEALARAFLAVSGEEAGGRHEAVLRLPAAAAGSLLGRKGATVSALRAETGAAVHVEREGTDRAGAAAGEASDEAGDATVLVTLEGGVAAVVAALRGVATLARVHAARSRGPAAPAGRGGAAGAEAEEKHGLTFNLDPAQVGALMGKGGANISQVRSVSGARVHLSPATEGEPGATRALEVSGSVEAVLAARNMVNAFLAVGGCSEAQPV